MPVMTYVGQLMMQSASCGRPRLDPNVELGLSLARGVFVVVEFSAAFIAFVLRHIVDPEPPRLDWG